MERINATKEDRARVKQLAQSGNTNESIAKRVGHTVEWVEQVKYGMAIGRR